jgi:hypothetical protein
MSRATKSRQAFSAWSAAPPRLQRIGYAPIRSLQLGKRQQQTPQIRCIRHALGCVPSAHQTPYFVADQFRRCCDQHLVETIAGWQWVHFAHIDQMTILGFANLIKAVAHPWE